MFNILIIVPSNLTQMQPLRAGAERIPGMLFILISFTPWILYWVLCGLGRDRHHACRISSPPTRIQSNGSHVAVIFRGGIHGHIHIRSSDIHREANLLRIPYIILDGVKTITSSIRHSADPDPPPLDAITNTSIMLYSAGPSLGSLS